MHPSLSTVCLSYPQNREVYFGGGKLLDFIQILRPALATMVTLLDNGDFT